MARVGSNIRRLRSDKAGGTHTYAVGIPHEMGEMLERAEILDFRVEWHDEGVLLRPVRSGDSDPSAPAWVTRS